MQMHWLPSVPTPEKNNSHVCLWHSLLVVVVCTYAGWPMQSQHNCMAFTSSSFLFALVYTGNAPGKTKEIGYNILVIMNCFGQMTQFFLSEYISVEANLFVILVTLLLAIPLFTVADHHFGSGRSRNCCGKKKQVVRASGDNTVSNGSKENGMYTLALFYIGHTVHASLYYYMSWSVVCDIHSLCVPLDVCTLMWKESTVWRVL